MQNGVSQGPQLVTTGLHNKINKVEFKYSRNLGSPIFNLWPHINEDNCLLSVFQSRCTAACASVYVCGRTYAAVTKCRVFGCRVVSPSHPQIQCVAKKNVTC